MLGKTSLAAVAVALFSLFDAAQAYIMLCGDVGLHYADGYIVRNMTNYSRDISGFVANTTFPLYFEFGSESSKPLYPIQLAQKVDNVYQVYDWYFYIDAGLDAVKPVSFVKGGNSTLTGGQTTWGFYNPYGIFLWMNTEVDPYGLIKRRHAARATVHQQGWQWVPIPGYTDISQLYWNQTRFDLVARGMAAGVNDKTTDFGMMYAAYDYTATAADGP